MLRLGRGEGRGARRKVTLLGEVEEEGVTVLRMEGNGVFGGRPRRGGTAGGVATGR